MDNDSWLFPEHLPFDDLFDTDGDGKITGFESFIRDDFLMNEMEDETTPKIPEYLKEEGEEYCIYPENYDSVEEFQEAVNEAKYGWRLFVDTDNAVLLDPEDYETEEEYEEALEQVKNGEAAETSEDDEDEDDDGAAAPKDYEVVNEYEGLLSEDSLKEINHQIQESQEKIESFQEQIKLIQEENEQAAQKKKTTAIILFSSGIGISFLLAVVYSLTTWGELDFSEIATLGFWLSLSSCCIIGLGYAIKQNADKANRIEDFSKIFHIAEDVKKEEQKLSQLISEGEQIKQRLENSRNNRE